MTKKAKKPKTIATLDAGPEARKQACVLLEVLSGMKTPSQAAEELAISLPRYYVLEARALEGFLKALEPRQRGQRVSSTESRLAEAIKEKDRLRRELTRSQSMLRLARKAAGLSPEKKAAKKNGKTAKKRKANRTRKVMALLKQAPSAKTSGTEKGASG